MTSEKQAFYPPGYNPEEWIELRYRMPTVERIEAMSSGNWPSPDTLRSRTNEEILQIREALEKRMTPEDFTILDSIIGEPTDKEGQPGVKLEEIVEEVLASYYLEKPEELIIRLEFLSYPCLTIEEIAEHLSLSTGSVAEIRERAIQKIRSTPPHSLRQLME